MKLGIIPARAGSKGLPGKNLREFAGKPLIVHTIEAALESRLDRVVVSTDDEGIAAVAIAAGADVPFLRPGHLATDEATTLDVVLHVIDQLGLVETDSICLLQPTSPLRSAADIDRTLEMADDQQTPVVSVTEFSKPLAWAYRVEAGVLVKAFEGASSRRQDAPPLYFPNGAIYVLTVQTLRQHGTFIPPRTQPYVMESQRSVDIDTALDFAIAEFLHGRANG